MNLRRKKEKRSAPCSVGWLVCPNGWSDLTGYSKLSENPEIQTAIQRVADLVSSMTIHLMENTKDGDKRIKNELSKKVDIEPCKYIVRKTFIEKIVKDMYTNGNSYVRPHYSGTLLDDLEPLPPDAVSIKTDPSGYGYSILVNGIHYDYDELLHFVYNPDQREPWKGRGARVLLNEVAEQMAQARKTRKALMANPAPSIIVKVDGLTEEFANKTGRDKLLEQYIENAEAGKPWLIPSEAFSVEQVKPLNLTDLAIIDSINLDKRTAAAIIGVPPFVVGTGEFDKEEYNNFIRLVVLPIARIIEQTLTKGLLLSPDWYFRFNPRSLYAYSVTELAEVDCNLVDRAIIDRNEARDDLGYTPREGLSELAILENYIPYSKIGDQGKLKGGEEGGAKKQQEE